MLAWLEARRRCENTTLLPEQVLTGMAAASAASASPAAASLSPSSGLLASVSSGGKTDLMWCCSTGLMTVASVRSACSWCSCGVRGKQAQKRTGDGVRFLAGQKR